MKIFTSENKIVWFPCLIANFLAACVSRCKTFDNPIVVGNASMQRNLNVSD